VTGTARTSAGTHAVVTGGSSGIGLAVVRRLAEAGARVSVLALGDLDLDRLREQPPPGLHPLHLTGVDVTDRTAVEDAVAVAVDHHGQCDLLVTSAGITRPGEFLELDAGEFERMVAVNYLGTVWPVRAVAGAMAARRSGSIAMLSSFAALLGVYGYTAYGPSKYAVRGFAETLRAELRPHGVHVACVFPTDVDTPMLAYEEPLKPPATRALSAGAATLTADQVAAALLRGVARRREDTYCDHRSALLGRVAQVAPALARRLTARTVARASR
jgi:3-dehydrosphinganine reductase